MVIVTPRGRLLDSSVRFSFAALTAAMLALAAPAEAQLVIEGHVTESGSGLPIVGATLVASPAGAPVETDAQGYYFMEVEAGLHSLQASAPGYLPQTRELLVEANMVEDFALHPEVFLVTGAVTDSVTGDPIPNAQLRASPDGPTVSADGDGLYTLELFDGSWTIEASAPGYQTHSRAVEVTSDMVEDFALQRDPVVVVGGRVRDDLGRWLSGARVDLVGGQRTRTQTTGADGSFTFTGIAINTLYSITASMDGHRSDSRNLSIGHSDLFDVILTLVYVPISHTLRGLVLDGATRDPLSGALISIPALDASTTSDRDGAFTFRLLPPGTHTLTARADGYADQTLTATVVDSDVEDVEILMGRDGSALTLSGLVTIAGLDLPIAGAAVRVSSATAAEQQTLTDVRGVYTFLGLSAGRYELVVTAGGYDPHIETLDLDLPTEHDVELERRPGEGFSLIGTVQLDGRPTGEWDGATLTLALFETPDTVLAEAQTGADGGYRFENLGPGRYRLDAAHGSFVSAGLTVLVASDTVQHFILHPMAGSQDDGLFGCDCASGGSGGLLLPLLLLLGLAGLCRSLVGSSLTARK